MKIAETESLDRMHRLFRAFADPVRLRVLALLVDREVCVCHLHEALGLPQPTVSRHLASLRKAGLVMGRKDGLWVHYRLTKPSSPLHERLLGCLTTCRSAESFVLDRDRLASLSACKP